MREIFGAFFLRYLLIAFMVSSAMYLMTMPWLGPVEAPPSPPSPPIAAASTN